MKFIVGTEVGVTSLHRTGRVLDVAANGRYRVAIGALTIWCEEADLTTVTQVRRQARRERSAPSGGKSAAAFEPAVRPTERDLRALGSIDLHGMTVEEALRAVQLRLDQAIRAGLDRLEIIHGISGGRLRAAVRGYLAGISSIARVEGDPHNAGVTWVFF